MSQAVTESLNIPAVRALRTVGASNVVKRASLMGISEKLYADDSLSLGSSCVAPASLLAAYSTIAAGGQRRPIRDVVRVVDAHQQTRFDVTSPLDQFAASRFRVDGLIRAAVEENPQGLSVNTAYLIQSALERVITNGTGRSGRIPGLGLAGKTGTTDLYDAWFAGFSRQYSAVVWVGDDGNRRALGRGETGGRVALPIWHRWMKAVHSPSVAGDLPVDKPNNVVQRVVDPRSGLLARSGREGLKLMFNKGTEPTERTRRIHLRGDDSLEALEGRF